MHLPTYSAKRRSFSVAGIDITPREILASVSIFAIMILVGILLSQNIATSIEDQNQEYRQAVKLSTAEEFQYGLRTDVGNAFCYGDLSTVDPVTYPELGGEYMYVSKTKKRYTRHEREVTKTRTNADGETETYTETEVYYTWDTVWSDSLHSSELCFNDVVFPYSKFQIPASHFITMYYEGPSVRYEYSGTDTHFTGTVYTCLSDHTLSDYSRFLVNKDPRTAMDSMIKTAAGMVTLFWLAWIFLSGFLIYFFCSHENAWLE